MPVVQQPAWETNSPDPLVDCVARFCLDHLDLFTITTGAGTLRLKEDICLPAEICEILFSTAKEQGIEITDELINIFQPGQTKLRTISLENCSVTDEGLRTLLSHNLRDIELKNCKNLTVNSLRTLNKYSHNLTRLEIGAEVYVLPDYLQPQGTFSDSDSEDEKDGNIYERQGYILHAPNLRSLSIRDFYIRKGAAYFDLLLKPFPGLLRLDLSGTNHNLGLKSFDWLQHCRLLVSLNLHNVKYLESSLSSLCLLIHLQHLDISQSKNTRGHFKDPVLFLQTLVESLPSLMSLDISGTNLASSNGVNTKITQDTKIPLCDIPGLSSRVNNPFNFLGLYKTDGASGRVHIPARSITGDSTEEQILLAGQLYLDRPSVLEDILNDLFQILRLETCQNLKLALKVHLRAMKRHLKEKHIQISGSASLFYIVKSESMKPDLNVKVKRKFLTILLNGMMTHKTDPTMMRNGCLVLTRMNMPQDVLYDYERWVRMLLHIVSEFPTEENNFLQRVGIFLLNTLACQVEGEHKLLLGKLGTIEKMLFIIRDKLNAGLCDDVLETAWSTMWNVTDETPSNCQRFLNGDGMKLFLLCKEKFPEKQDLLRNMMGLLGNVAEVPHLRPYLMTSEFVDEFSFMLDSNSDGIEVSYNAAGVLAHMASDGPEAWTIKEPDREFVLNRMVRAINRWQMDSKRNINYRSFEPIIRLLPVSHTPECQLWAVWAVANLTKVSPDKYCSLVEAEGGLHLVEEMLNSNSVLTSRADVLNYAQQVRSNVLEWKEKQLNLDYDG